MHQNTNKAGNRQYLRHMNATFRIVLTILFSAAVFNAWSQPLYRQKTDGPYKLLYKLSNEQALFLASHPDKADSQYLYTRLVGKVHTDSIIPLWKPTPGYPVSPFCDWYRYQRFNPRFFIWDIRENGYYLEVTVNSFYSVQYRLIENPLFSAAVHRVGYETFIFVEDTAGIPVSDASVMLDTAHCLFDASVGGYRIPGKEITGRIHISRGNEFAITRLYGATDKSNNTAPPRDRFSYAKIRYQGYLVTNKPKYKSWDTLFFKSYLVNHKGKPIREKLYARLWQNYTGYAREYEVKPAVRGDYFGFVVINDSFATDQPATISLLNTKRQMVLSQQVYIENYELKDISFSVRQDKQMVTPGGNIRFDVSAFTVNRLPVMDGKIKMEMSLNSVNYMDGDSVVIPFDKMQHWYSRSLQTDPSGVTSFEIPDSVFISLDGQFYVVFTLMTGDNEMRQTTASFYYKTTRDRVHAFMHQDTVEVHRMFNMKDVVKKMRIKVYSHKDLLVDSAFYTPAKFYLAPNIYRVEILSGDTVANTFYRSVDLPEIKGERTHDSIHISFVSKPDVPVFYRIYANNKLVEKGHATSLHYHAADKSKNSYHLQYGVLEGSVLNPRFYSQSFHLSEKKLKVEIVQPETIYPGQEVAIEIRVKDAYGKPVKKVNLAAWAVNTQMEDIVTPDVPYLGLVKPQKSLPTMQYPLYALPNILYGTLKPWQVEAYKLRQNKFFELVYPRGGFEVLQDTTPEHSTEIAFFAHGLNNRQQIQYVKANDTLIYHNSLSPAPHSYRINPGVYNFQVRMFNKIYSFKNVTIVKGKKNFLCLQTDTLNALKYGDSMPAGRPSQAEVVLIGNHGLLLRFDVPLGDTLLIKVNGKLRQAFQPYVFGNATRQMQLKTTRFNPGKANRYSEVQNFQLFGPLNAGDQVQLEWKNNYAHEFEFQPGHQWSFTRTDAIREDNTDWAKQMTYFTYLSQEGYNLNEFWWNPYRRDTSHATTNPPPGPYEYVNSLEKFEYRNYSPYETHIDQWHPLITNSYLNLYIGHDVETRRIWLFDKDDSSFSTLENGDNFGTVYSEVYLKSRRNMPLYSLKKELHRYRLMVQVNDSLWFVKSLNIDSSVYLFYRIANKDLRKLTESEFLYFDRLAKELAREPMSKFVDTPTIDQGLVVIPVKTKETGSRIEGTLSGPSLLYVVPNAFIVLEKNGLFVKGAISNREGRFVLENLSPGTYMLKAKAENYNYWIHYSISIQAGTKYILQAKMKPYAWFTYQQTEVLYDIAAKPSGAYEGEASFSFSNAPVYYSNDKIATVEARGARTSGKKYKLQVRADAMADSESVVSDGDGTSDFYEKDEAAGGEFATYQWSFGDEKRREEGDRLNQLAGDANANRIRRDFRDYAYWKPNLYTNKNGMAGFTVRFPDNVTSWKTFVPAMDGKRHSGMGELTVRAYKPVVSTLAVPQFLYEGDLLHVLGRTMNYTGQTLNGNYYLLYNQIGNRRSIALENVYTDSLNVQAGNAGDSINISSSFELQNGYRDGESRNITIIPSTVTGGQSEFREISADTSLLFVAAKTDIGMQVAVYNQRLAIVLDLLKQSESQNLYDNQSLANYLNALLMKQEICKLLNIPFDGERNIRETMGKIKKSMRPDGFFGWFTGSKSNYVVSTTVADVMYKAQQMGYDNNTWLNIARAMEKQLPNIHGNERLQYLLSLAGMKRSIDFDSMMKGLNPVNFNYSMKLDYVRLNQRLGKKTDVMQLVSLMRNTYQGNQMVPGDWIWEFAPVTDDVSNTYKLWEILFHNGELPAQRKALISYLSEESGNANNASGKAAWAMMQEARAENNIGGMKPVVEINGKTVPAEQLPKVYYLKPGDSLRLKHSGASVYIAANRTFRTYNPVSDGREFRTEITLPRMNNGVLPAGIETSMKVRVFAARTQYNAVVEIPIPAGCVYGSKIQGEDWNEVHREYKPEKVLIYCDQLSFGYHTFTINLVPKFAGTFHTPPARSALMFYPDKAGYSPAATWNIAR